MDEKTELLQKINNIEIKLKDLRGTPAETTLVKVLTELKRKLSLLDKTTTAAPIKTPIKDKPLKVEPFYQVISWISAEVVETKVDNKQTVKKLIYQGKEYDCKFLLKKDGGFVTSLNIFSKCVTNKGEMILGVYPRWIHFPSKEKPAKLYFEIFSWNNVPPDRKVNYFYLSGIWQFIPVCKQPVISVYRNKKRHKLDKLKVNHCPIFWRDSPVKPYRFNPKTKGKDSAKYFVQTLCTLDRVREQLVVKKFTKPITDIPKYKKPVKAAPLSKQK